MKFTSTFLNLLSFAGVALSASQTVLVGVDANNQPGLFFTPNAITAAVGDTVNFAFLGGNHVGRYASMDSFFLNPKLDFDTISICCSLHAIV